MENEIKELDFSKPISRKCTKSLRQILGYPEETIDEEKSEIKDPILKKKIKVSEGNPPAIKTFCRIRPTEIKNGIYIFRNFISSNRNEIKIIQIQI